MASTAADVPHVPPGHLAELELELGLGPPLALVGGVELGAGGSWLFVLQTPVAVCDGAGGGLRSCGGCCSCWLGFELGAGGGFVLELPVVCSLFCVWVLGGVGC